MIAVIAIVFVMTIAVCFVSTKKPKSQASFIDQDLYKFLEVADEAYMDMYIYRDIRYFSQYATGSLVDEFKDTILSAEERLFASEKYRTRTWNVLQQGNGIMTVEKKVVYRDIKVHDGVRLKIGDDVQEVWTVVQNNGKFYVEDVINELNGRT